MQQTKSNVIGPIPWGHSGPPLSRVVVVVVVVVVVDIDAQAASVATPGEWRVRRLAVANGPNIFQMLLVQLTIVFSFAVLYGGEQSLR